jgi:hypothetical protein
MTARRLIRSCDPIQLCKLIVEIATGQVEDQDRGRKKSCRRRPRP